MTLYTPPFGRKGIKKLVFQTSGQFLFELFEAEVWSQPVGLALRKYPFANQLR